MDRAARVAQLWSWLPAFRAVAETEHLPTAARTMGLTPSALSRSVTQLEAAVGCPLFSRVGRRLQLAPAGGELLAAVRDAMRRVDDGLARLADERPTGIRVAGDGAWLGVVWPPVDAEIEHVDVDLARLRDGLVRGTIDLAIVEAATPVDGLVIERLGSVAQAVVGDPRARFASCTSRDEAWPSEHARTIGLRSPHLDVIVDACRAGTARAVLPVAIARAHDLATHATPRLHAARLYLVRRVPLGTSPVEAVVPAIRDRASAVLSQRRR